MFFNKKNLIDSYFFRGFTDYHSHILPGVDDGVYDTDEALEILNWYEVIGVSKVVFTPHIMEDFPKNNPENLRLEFSKFKELYKGNIELSLGAEYMLDSKFEQHLDSGDMLTLRDNYLLVECSFMEAPVRFFELMQKIMQKGYFVVLAHPERYPFFSEVEYRRLKDMGVMFQLNILSLLGGYGKGPARRAKKLLDLSFYDLVGTDIHSIRYHKKYLPNEKLSGRTIAKMVSAINSNPWF